MYEVISSSANNGLYDEYRYTPDYDPEQDIINLIEDNLREYWQQFPNEVRPKYYQDQWYLDGESEPYIEF